MSLALSNGHGSGSDITGIEHTFSSYGVELFLYTGSGEFLNSIIYSIVSDCKSTAMAYSAAL